MMIDDGGGWGLVAFTGFKPAVGHRKMSWVSSILTRPRQLSPGLTQNLTWQKSREPLVGGSLRCSQWLRPTTAVAVVAP